MDEHECCKTCYYFRHCQEDGETYCYRNGYPTDEENHCDCYMRDEGY